MLKLIRLSKQISVFHPSVLVICRVCKRCLFLLHISISFLSLRDITMVLKLGFVVVYSNQCSPAFYFL